MTRAERIAACGAVRLLVVEDRSDLRAALQSFFKLLGYQARFAENVASALRAADEESFDVLLSDIGLPDGTGWDLLRTLAETGRRPPYAIAMSGFGLEEDLAQSKAAGFAVHLVKPVLPEELERVLKAVQARLNTDAHRPAAKSDAASKSKIPCRAK